MSLSAALLRIPEIVPQNMGAGDNDRQIRTIYHALDIERLREYEEAGL